MSWMNWSSLQEENDNNEVLRLDGIVYVFLFLIDLSVSNLWDADTRLFADIHWEKSDREKYIKNMTKD